MMKYTFFKSILFPAICLAVAFTACNSSTTSDKTDVKIDSSYITTIDGKSVQLYTLANKSGAS